MRRTVKANGIVWKNSGSPLAIFHKIILDEAFAHEPPRRVFDITF
jgi:hypothetical protein